MAIHMVYALLLDYEENVEHLFLKYTIKEYNNKEEREEERKYTYKRSV